ncbi:peptidase M50 [Streptomyces sp. NPDC048172]|uniref:peptidase M50 n=1 Tax=Streptomyces sp. NPDC048172 TaxID=3365505 RepID=UPI003718DAC2
MTTQEATDWLQEARPRLREDVRIGPLVTKGPTGVHLVGDRRTGAFVKVGPREAFLMGRLDGHRSLAQIGDAYAAEFGKRLAVQHWRQLLGMLASRGLIEPADPARLDEVRERAEAARRAEGRSPLLWRLPVRGAAELVPGAARRLGWLLHPFAVAPLGLAGALVALVTLLHWSQLYGALSNAPGRWSATAVAFALTWLTIAAHEFGHGVACHRYGGRPTQIGVMWRFPLIAPYCKVDDVVTFPRRAHRVMTAFAGIYVNLLALLPSAALWWWGPDGGWWHGLAGGLLVLGTATTVGNLVPFLKLDGYHMLEHATSTMHLQSESFRYAGAVLRGRTFAPEGYPPRARWIFTGYVLLTVAVLGPALVLLVRMWFVTLAGVWGAVGAALFLLAEAVVVAVFLRWALVWRKVDRDGKSGQPEKKES